MGYKSKSFKGFGGQGGSYRSGFLKIPDMMARYRQPSAPESEYDRRLKNSISRSETNGPSRFTDSDPNYREFLARRHEETKDIFKDFDQQVEDAVKKAVEDFRRREGTEMPQEIYETERDRAIESAERFEMMKESPEDFYSQIIPLQRENTIHQNRVESGSDSSEFNTRYDQVMKQSTEDLRKAHEIIETFKNPVEPNLYTDMGGAASYAEPTLPDTSLGQNTMKRRNSSWDSEVDAM